MVTAGVQDADIVFIAGALNNMIHSVHVQPRRELGRGLKGKLWGSDRPGTPNDFATVRAIEKLGLPTTDLQILNIGRRNSCWPPCSPASSPARCWRPPRALRPTTPATPSSPTSMTCPTRPLASPACARGYPPLEPSLLPFLRAYRDGLARYDSDKAFAIKVLDDYAKIGDARILDRTYDFYKTRGWNRSLAVSEPGVQTVIDFVARIGAGRPGRLRRAVHRARYVQQLGPP